MDTKIESALQSIIVGIEACGSDADKIKLLNEVRQKLNECSPMKNEPVDCVVWVEQDKIKANDYNPNAVAPPEMKLLEHSIREDGYTQPIVSWQNNGYYEVVDGFHRNRIGRESEDIRSRIKGYLPLTVIKQEREGRSDRISATIRHNRARGVHSIEPMSKIVTELYFSGWSNKRIAKELGMELDEINRLKQITGLGSLFTSREYSKAWE